MVEQYTEHTRCNWYT